MKTTSVALGPYFEDFIKAQIAQGRYNNIRIAALKSEIEEGLNSGEAVDFDPSSPIAPMMR